MISDLWQRSVCEGSMLVHPACLTPVRVGMSVGPEMCEGLRLVNRLRNTNPVKFRSYVMMHMSFLLDLPDAQLEQFLSERPSGAPAMTEDLKVKKHFFSKRKNSKGDRCHSEPSCLFGASLSRDTMEQIMPLLAFLGRPENITQEGLFRKSGQLNRQKCLREKLEAGEDVTLDLDDGVFSAHDAASVLKAYLSELPEPILQERYYPAYCQVLDMVQTGLETELAQLKRSKQLQTVQLLLQLLPRENLQLLECLLDLLHRVVMATDNKMSADALGTLLAPCILVPRKMTGTELHTAAANITRVVGYMIDNARELFRVPESLVLDIAKYWEEMEEADPVPVGSCSSLDEADGHMYRYRKRTSPSDAVTTTVTFVDRALSMEAAAQTDTQVALAQLYAHVNAMPESAKKKKLLKQFNKANGTGTPCVNRHKRSKSFGESIKKMVGRNHKRRGSGHPSQVPSILSTQSSLGSPCVPATHTPVIRRCQASRSPTPCTPVMRLAKHSEFQTPLLPSSPRVHIVDMQSSSAEAMSLARKRKLSDGKLPAKPRPLSLVQPCRLHPEASSLADSSDSDEGQENIPLFAATAKLPASPLLPTERRFQKPTAYISPISRTVNKAPKALQAHIMTPGSRRPMAVLQTP